MRLSRMGIVNSLLRIDNVQGEAPLPFERPNAPMNFWVLELPDGHDSVRKLTVQVARLLRKHSKLLRQNWNIFMQDCAGGGTCHSCFGLPPTRGGCSPR